MADHVSPEKRSFIMSQVKTRDTKPEMKLRSALHKAGFRYRLHRKGLPGKPDLVFLRQKKVIFVHGCYWHGHGCKWGRLPKSRLRYWKPKIKANRSRDLRNVRELRRAGWNVLVVWQCELRDFDATFQRVARFVDGRNISLG